MSTEKTGAGAPSKKPLSTDPYKGVRDFYPAEMAVQNHIFGTMRKVVERFGYSEYGASVLEPAELYKAKSGEEIINEQTYTFIDRGEREVTLRPEMTPTVARMIAAERKVLSFPLRWYSIPNLFRYEQPQKGRLREHWQLNVDIFGVKSIQAEVEGISIASGILREFGLKDTDFEILVNSRKVMNYILGEVFALDAEAARVVSKLIDRKEKMPASDFAAKIEAFVGIKHDHEKTQKFLAMLNSQNFDEFISHLPESARAAAAGHEAFVEVQTLLGKLEALGITNARFSQTLMRGFDYYTGIVFEVFDTSPENRRSVFGGGRYDDLLDIFGAEKVAAFGFGAGDVVLRDLLESRNLLPSATKSADLYLAVMGSTLDDSAQEIAQELREAGVRVAVDYSGRKIGDQIKYADKQNIPFVIVIGEEEVKSGTFKLKNLKSGEEKVVKAEEIAKIVLN
ncbi:MAG: histidine--tRNA ligase [bacterium]